MLDLNPGGCQSIALEAENGRRTGEEGEEGILTSATTPLNIRPTNTQLLARPAVECWLFRASSLLRRALPPKHRRLPRKQRRLLVVEKRQHLLRREDPRIALLGHPHASWERLHMRPQGGYVHPLELLHGLFGIALVWLLLSPQGGRRELLLLLLELVREGGRGGDLIPLLLLGRGLRVGLALGLVLAVVVVWEGGGEGGHVECGFPAREGFMNVCCCCCAWEG